ncbi:type II toxin-antitoxin system antitoxin SocA domain-containing protein [Arthrobacter sp. Br18]|uniref:Panacea domain-containing protein n=1 Tax=Arthrobacter sp. Br18 TaxID=1312954 RepID=UPI00047AF486|nr:type II toxin-antitoxin system antitoxin SocA domain-containing protein [Arthrobacter sp. Br18]
MANVHDVAAYILEKQGSLSAMKLQKLAYYSQAWHLVWEERQLFEDDIQAWANGPVIYALYDRHRGNFRVDTWTWGDPDELEDNEKETIDAVLDAYGQYTAHELSEMTHREDPWRDAREGLREGARSSAPITQASMHEYYHGLSN